MPDLVDLGVEPAVAAELVLKRGRVVDDVCGLRNSWPTTEAMLDQVHPFGVHHPSKIADHRLAVRRHDGLR